MSKDKLHTILEKFDDDNYEYMQSQRNLKVSLETWNRDKAKLRKEAKKAILDWLDEAFGEDETWANPHAQGQIIQQNSRNELRAELRKKLGIK